MSELIRDRYEPLGVVGTGGQGELLRARDRLHDRVVAVKVRRIGSEAERDAVLSEARILLGLAPHPSLATAREDFVEGDAYHLVMDWVDGRDLGRVLAAEGTPGLDCGRVVGWLAQAADALDHLGDQRPPVVHGDVKPANLVLTDDGRVVLVDFGISSLYRSSGGPVNGDRRWGTPPFSAPELAAGAPGPAADVYGLAATAYTLLTGSPPAPGVRPAFHGMEPAAAERVMRALRRGLATDPALRPSTPLAFVEALRAAATPSPRPGPPDPGATPECPYRGLSAFREADAPYFRGRGAATAALVAKVADEPFVAVVGPSGSGKSSLVWAGLVPWLHRSGSWVTAGFRPGHRPFHALAAALLTSLEPAMTETERLVEVDTLAAAIAIRDGFLADVIRRVTEKSGAQRLLVVVDQFEELYTGDDRTPDPAFGGHRRFVDRLLEATAGPARQATVVVTLRADFLGRALAQRPLADALQRGDVKLGPMTADELAEAIEAPALTAGVAIEDGLTRRLLDDVADEPGHLPLLEFALTMLWGRREADVLTHAAYQRMGGVERCLAGYADEVFEALRPDDRSRAQGVLLQLVRPGEGTEDTRRAASRADIGEDDWEIVTSLARTRLVVTGRDETTGVETVEVVHEALIRQWGRLRRWMAAERSFRSWQERLRAALRAWEASGWDEGALLRGGPLAEAADWMGQRPGVGNPGEQAFVEASAAWARREEEAAADARRHELDQARALAEEHRRRAEAERARARQQTRSTRLLRLAAAALVVLLAVAVGTAAAVRDQRNESRRLRLVALTEAMAARVGAELEERLDERAILVARQAWLFDRETGGSRNPVVDRALRQALGAPNFSRILGGYRRGVAALAVSPDGRFLATGSAVPPEGGSQPDAGGPDAAGSLVVRDLDDPVADPVLFGGHRGGVSAVAWRPGSGGLLASGGVDGTVRLWAPGSDLGRDSAARSRRALTVLDVGVPITSLAFAPGGRSLATGSADGSVRIWDVSRARRSGTGAALTGTPGAAGIGALTTLDSGSPVGAVAVSPAGGNLLAVGGEDGAVRLWNIAEASLVAEVNSGTPIHSLAFDPEGVALAAGTGGGAVDLWDVSSGGETTLRRRLTGHAGAVNSVAFSADGATLASGGNDRSVRIAVLAGDSPAAVLRGHTGPVSSVAFTGEGPALVSGSADKTVRLWDLGESGPAREVVRSHTGMVAAATFSPEGRHLATAGADDRMIYVHDLAEPGRPPVGLGGATDAPVTVAFSPDGSTLASGTRDGTVRLWDFENLERPPDVIAAGTPIHGIDLGPGGTLAMAAADRTVKVYDLARPNRLPVVLRGHKGEVAAVAFSPDGRRLVSGSADRTVRVWTLARPGSAAQINTGHTGGVNAVAWSSDGTRVASGGDDLTVRIWSPGSRGAGKPGAVGVLRGPVDEISSVAFSPEGEGVAAAAGDGKIRLWDLRTPDAGPLVLRSHGNEVASVEYSPDGGRIVSGGDGGTVVIEPTRTATLAAAACRRVGRDLTPGEWKELVGPALPYRPVCSRRST